MAFTSYRGPDFCFDSPTADQGPLPAILAAWHRRAVAAGRVPCVYLTAAWCPPSVLLEKSLDDPRMRRALREVEAATFNIDTWADPLKELGFQVHTIPIFFILDADGRPVGPAITGGAWGENTPENMAPPLERFFDAARATRPARPASSKLGGVLLVVLAVALIAAAAWLKVRADEDLRREADRESDEKLRKSIQDSIQRSLEAQKRD